MFQLGKDRRGNPVMMRFIVSASDDEVEIPKTINGYRCAIERLCVNGGFLFPGRDYAVNYETGIIEWRAISISAGDVITATFCRRKTPLQAFTEGVWNYADPVQEEG